MLNTIQSASSAAVRITAINPCSKTHPAWIDKLSKKHINFLAGSINNIEHITYTQKYALTGALARESTPESTLEITTFLKDNIDVAMHIEVHMQQCMTKAEILSSNLETMPKYYSFQNIKQIFEKMPACDVDRLLHEYPKEYIRRMENGNTVDKINIMDKSCLLFKLYCNEDIRQPFAVIQFLFSEIINKANEFPFSFSDCLAQSQFSDQYHLKLDKSIAFNLNSSKSHIELLNFIASNQETLKNALYADEILNEAPKQWLSLLPIREDKKYAFDDEKLEFNYQAQSQLPENLLIVNSKNDEIIYVDDGLIEHLPITKYNELISINHQSVFKNAKILFNDTATLLRQNLQNKSNSTAKYIECYFNNYKTFPLYQALKNKKITPQQYQYLVTILFARAYIKEFSSSAFIKNDTGNFVFDAVGFKNYLNGKGLAKLVPYIIKTTPKTVNKKTSLAVDKTQPLFESFTIKAKIHENILDKHISPHSLELDLDILILSTIGVAGTAALEQQSFNYVSVPKTKAPTHHILMRILSIEFIIMALKLQPDVDSSQCEKLANKVCRALSKKYKLPKVDISGIMHEVLKLVHKYQGSVEDAVQLLEQMKLNTVGEITLFGKNIGCDVLNASNFILRAFSDNHTPYNRSDFALQQSGSTTKAFINFICANLPTPITNRTIMQYVELLKGNQHISNSDYSKRTPLPRRYIVPQDIILKEINSGNFGSDSVKKQVLPKVGVVSIGNKQLNFIQKLLGYKTEMNMEQIKKEFIEHEDLVSNFLNNDIASEHPNVAEQLKNILSFQRKIEDIYSISVSEAHRCYSIYQDDSTQERTDFLLIKLITGESRAKVLTIKQTKQIMAQFIDSIKLMYLGRVSHRDLHAGNIKIVFDENDDPLVKIFDFGAAKVGDLCDIEADIRYLFLREGVTQDSEIHNFVEGAARKYLDEPKHYPLHRLLMELGFGKEEATEFLEKVGSQLLKELQQIKDSVGTSGDKLPEETIQAKIEQAFDDCKQVLLTRCAIYTNSVISDIDITKILPTLELENISRMNAYLNKITQEQPEQRALVIELLCILKNCANNRINLKPMELLATFKDLILDNYECLAVINNLEREITNINGNGLFMKLVDDFSISELRQNFVGNNKTGDGRGLLEKLLTKDIYALTINPIEIVTMQHMDSEELVLAMVLAKEAYKELSKGSNYTPPDWLISYINQKYRPYVDANKVTLITPKQELAIMTHISEADRKKLAEVLNGNYFDLGTMFSCLGWETALENPKKLNYKRIPPALLNLIDPLANNLAMKKRSEMEKVPFEGLYLDGAIRNFGMLEKAYLDYLENKEQIDNILEDMRLAVGLDDFAIETYNVKRNKIAISSKS